MFKQNALVLFIIAITATACFKSETKLSPKEELGKKLFFDPRISMDGSISCNSCHNVMNGGSDNRKVSMGVNGALGSRNSPTVFNAVFLSVQFWDGRAKDLKEQAKGPMTNPIEMGNLDHTLVVDRLKKIPGYVKEFKTVFKEEQNPINIENVASAIADYEATLTTLNSPYDKNTMNDAQKKGFETFKSVGCTTCHSGPHFAGPELETGKGFYQKFPLIDGTEYDEKYAFTDDLGRFEVTVENADKSMFRVPTLRNVALTAPYFHNGAVRNLDEAVRVMGKTQLNKDLSEEEVTSIVEFLKALTGTIPEQTFPMLPPTPGTYVAED